MAVMSQEAKIIILHIAQVKYQLKVSCIHNKGFWQLKQLEIGKKEVKTKERLYTFLLLVV